MLDINDSRIGIIGLGYVGLPLAAEFAKKYKVVGFDINQSRVDQLKAGVDYTLEVKADCLKKVLGCDKDNSGLVVTSDQAKLKSCNVYIVTVPTPINKHNHPDLNPLFRATETVANVLKRGDVVVYESTVYPGVTEEECAPILEKISGLKMNNDFYLGYSPERINPGDKEHTVTKILKITSGSTAEAALFIDSVYKSVITAGTYLAPSIKVAEAAKVIENAQRDINIAFVNELAKIFNIMKIDTTQVLEAAATKWNFLNFRPGLVGGHCIGVDPYYLAQKAQELGHHPEIILSGRRVNDSIGHFVADQIIKLMVKKDIPVKGASILILGFTFKENCPDVRNTRVIDIVEELDGYKTDVVIFDPWADRDEVTKEYGVEIKAELNSQKYDAVVLAVAHNQFLELDLSHLLKPVSVVFDVKSFLPLSMVDCRL